MDKIEKNRIAYSFGHKHSIRHNLNKATYKKTSLTKVPTFGILMDKLE